MLNLSYLAPVTYSTFVLWSEKVLLLLSLRRRWEGIYTCTHARQQLVRLVSPSVRDSSVSSGEATALTHSRVKVPKSLIKYIGVDMTAAASEGPCYCTEGLCLRFHFIIFPIFCCFFTHIEALYMQLHLTPLVAENGLKNAVMGSRSSLLLLCNLTDLSNCCINR